AQEMSSTTTAYTRPAASLGHSGMTVERYYLTHAFGALFPLAAGILVYGWRVVLAIMLVMLPAAGTLLVWRRIGLRGRRLRRPHVSGHDAIDTLPAAEYLSSYTTGQVSPERVWLSLESLLRDRVPPLEDLILGAHPGPIGTSSAIAVIIGGLFLLYRGQIDHRVPLLIVASAFVALLVLPVPAVITERPDWRWAGGHVRGIGWSMGVTFANYEILA